MNKSKSSLKGQQSQTPRDLVALKGRGLSCSSQLHLMKVEMLVRLKEPPKKTERLWKQLKKYGFTLRYLKYKL